MTRGAGKGISDRSGKAYPISELVKEPGTGYIVHFTESDGMWNIKDHPQNHIKGWTDKMTLKNSRPEVSIPSNFTYNSLWYATLVTASA